jgi:hypothetical protein
MTQPVIHDYLTQIFVKHYKIEPNHAAEEALRFLEIAELYGMQLIMGEWTVPEPVDVAADPFTQMFGKNMRETMQREPWLAREIQ